jgi:hypothetical protein
VGGWKPQPAREGSSDEPRLDPAGRHPRAAARAGAGGAPATPGHDRPRGRPGAGRRCRPGRVRGHAERLRRGATARVVLHAGRGAGLRRPPDDGRKHLVTAVRRGAPVDGRHAGDRLEGGLGRRRRDGHDRGHGLGHERDGERNRGAVDAGTPGPDPDRGRRPGPVRGRALARRRRPDPRVRVPRDSSPRSCRTTATRSRSATRGSRSSRRTFPSAMGRSTSRPRAPMSATRP